MISLNIKIIREKKEMSKEYLAIQMDLSMQEYEKLENGTLNLKLSKLDQLAKILGVKKSELFVLIKD